ncbi:diacylglycerol kinase (ATP) [Sphaerotilus hippei]|uniref:Diacylglycerol kinase (ATP) n=1 Tax=Sphaerotilus hippei TaxID=744406 RepID=A0A318GX08_9BURK|nr:diacylglycerol kinase family protein [Sphaerotilus hippei]PXW94305.1 diacylglycerol kinase (ATP) [Sphaerotilus hippei]
MPCVSRAAALRHAWRGVVVLLRGEVNARLHVAAALGCVALGAWLRLDRREWVVLALAITLVIVAEALNTAIERVVDLASPEWHALARDAKDVAAGAVLIASAGAVVVGLLVFGPRLWSLWMP